MNSIRNRLSRLETASAQFSHLVEMSDSRLASILWVQIHSLCPKYGIRDAPEQFPGVEEAEAILGDSFDAILEELAQ